MGDFQPRFYFKPKTLHEVSLTLAKYAGNSVILGGGTEIYEFAQRGLLSGTEALVDLADLSLNEIKIGKDYVSIGASSTLAQLEQYEELYENGRLGCLLDALSEFHSPQVKNVATIGGAVSSCIPFFDIPIALAALGSLVEVSGPEQIRRVPLLDFQKDFLQPDLNDGEFVSGLLIPNVNASRASAFTKFAQTEGDWATVSCAGSIELSRGKIKDAVLVFGAISTKPFLASKTAEALVDWVPNEEIAEKAARMLNEELADASTDHRASSAYRRRIAKVLLRSTIEKASVRSRS